MDTAFQADAFQTDALAFQVGASAPLWPDDDPITGTRWNAVDGGAWDPITGTMWAEVDA